MVELVEYIAKSLVDDPSEVRVTETSHSGTITIELQVAQEDMGRIIGKNGRVANAMRTLVRVVASNEGKRANLDIL